jgi:hypothetical protein
MNQPIPYTWENAKSPPSITANMLGWAWQKMYSSEEHMVVGSPSQYEYAPSSTLHEDSQDMAEKRVCHSCSRDVRVRIDHKDLYTVFLLLGDFGVGPKEWKCILSIPGTNVWKKVCTLLSQQWTKVTAIMPYQRASKPQRKLLHYMRRYLSPQHIGFYTAAAKEKIRMPKRFIASDCENMGCRLDCRTVPNSVKALVALVFGHRDHAVRQFQRLESPREFSIISRCMVNLLASATVVDPFLVADVLVPLLNKNSTIALMVYFSLSARSQDTADTLHQYLPANIHREIKKTQAWIQCMLSLSNTPDSTRAVSCHFEPCMLPMRPEIEVYEILTDSIVQKKSSSQPVVIPCRCRERGKSIPFVKCFMVKREDVRPDAMVMEFNRMLSIALEAENLVPIEKITYDVLPLSSNSGIVSLVAGARTLYSLHNDSTTLQNWVIENNAHYTIDYIRGRFLRSCAFSTVVSMILSVGDRHLENVMMTRQGLLFHIDYAHLLGSEPAAKTFIGNTCRITQGMVEFLGGVQSTYYKQFQRLCGEIYSKARKWILVLYASVMPLVFDGLVTQDFLEGYVDRIFCPHEKEVEARVKVEDRVDRESGSTNWTDTLTDSIHHMWTTFKT